MEKGTLGTALVTGGAVRLGREIALDLAQKGYNIALHYNSSIDKAKETSDHIRGKGVSCEIFQADFFDLASPEKLLGEVANRFTDLCVLINCASIYDEGGIFETTPEMMENNFRVNFYVPYFLSQMFAKKVQSGNVINILDNKVFFNQYQYNAYLLSKKTLAEFTKMGAVELAPSIRLNGIAPGVIMPGEKRTDNYIQWRVEGIPMKQTGDHQDICKAIDFFLNNPFVTGQILSVDGGESVSLTGRNYPDYANDR